jgi:hypothetical protein
VRAIRDVSGVEDRSTLPRWTPSAAHLPDMVTETILRAAAARHPDDKDRLYDLAKHLFDCGRFSEVIALVTPAAEAGEASALRLNGEALLAAGRHADAIPWLEAARRSGSAAGLSGLIRAVAPSGDDRRAADLCREALKQSPNDAFALAAEARRLFATDGADRVALLCQSLRRRGGSSALIDSIEGVAMARLGRSEEARLLIGQRRLRVASRPADVDLAALADEIVHHPNLQQPILPQATRDGRRVDRPLVPGAPLLRRIEIWLKREVERYVAGADYGWPLDWRQTPVRLRVWAVVMGPDTVQEWHMHPSSAASSTSPRPAVTSAPARARACSSLGCCPSLPLSTIGHSAKRSVLTLAGWRSSHRPTPITLARQECGSPASPSRSMSCEPDMANDDFSHVAASRDGIFLVSRTHYRKILDGLFFGVTLERGFIYAFEALGPRGSAAGRIVRFGIEQGVAVDHQIMADELDGGCHQIDIFGDRLFVVDTHHQRLVSFDRAWRRTSHYPLPIATFADGFPAYRHLNSFHGRGASIYLILHNLRHQPSELVTLDRDLRIVRRLRLLGTSCHDIVRTETGEAIVCDSDGGRLIGESVPLAKVDTLFTRGLAVGDAEIAVGSSLFGARPVRDLVPGFVTFMDRRFRPLGRLHLPAAPTQIRRLDEADLSLSSPRCWA